MPVLRALVWLARGLCLFVVCTVVVPLAVAVTVLGSLLFLPLPATLPPARVTPPSVFSHVLDASGHEIALFRAFDVNLPAARADIPLVLKQAVIASEDRNFYRHGGVDPRGTARALVADLQGDKVVQGGSTITQQYVKLAYTSGERTVARKVREAVLASQLDRQVDKDEILFRYLSSIYLGDGNYGVAAAAQSYFRKPVSQLDASEAATLAGIIPAPSRFAPRDDLGGAEQRRRLVLGEMRDQGYLSPADYDQAIAKALRFASITPGPATMVWPRYEPETKYPYFVDYVRRYLLARYGPDLVFKGGLTIQTSLDPTLQAEAEASVAVTLSGTNPDLQMSLVTVEPPTGLVRALVGGRDFADQSKGQVNLALGGCEPRPVDPKVTVEVEASCWSGPTVTGGGSGRQPGSAFKAFTLAAAFARGVPPTTSYPAVASYVPKGCRSACTAIRNAADGEGNGEPMDLRTATADSVNTVFVQLEERIGVRSVSEMAKRLGVTSAWESPQVQGLSYTLGTQGVSPLDMASAYGVFAARGLRAEPTPVLKIVDPAGRVVEDNTHRAPTRVLDEAVADNVTDVLRGPLESGTARGKGIGRPAAGKTGTTDDYRDAWFVGYTPTLSTSVWMGYTKPTSMRNVKGVRQVFGGTLPAQTWHDFMVQATRDVPVTDFSDPAPIKPPQDQTKQVTVVQPPSPGPRRPVAGTPRGGPYEAPAPSLAPPPPPGPGATVVPPATTTTAGAPPGPAATVPAGTVPAGTVPAGTVPAGTGPAATAPATSAPGAGPPGPGP